MVIFIVIGTLVIQCLGDNCTQLEFVPFKLMLTLGFMELIADYGIVKLFKRKKGHIPSEKDKNPPAYDE